MMTASSDANLNVKLADAWRNVHILSEPAGTSTVSPYSLFPSDRTSIPLELDLIMTKSDYVNKVKNVKTESKHLSKQIKRRGWDNKKRKVNK